MTEWGVQLYFWGRVGYRFVCSRDLSAALSCVERGGSWDRLDPPVAGLSHEPTIGREASSDCHWRSVAGDCTVPRRVFPAPIPAWGCSRRRPSHTYVAGALFAALALAVTLFCYVWRLYRTSISMTVANAHRGVGGSWRCSGRRVSRHRRDRRRFRVSVHRWEPHPAATSAGDELQKVGV